MAKAKKADSNKASLGGKIKTACKDASERVKNSELSDKIVLFVGILLVVLALVLNFVEVKHGANNSHSIILAVSFINGILGMVMIMMVLSGTRLDAVNETSKKK